MDSNSRAAVGFERHALFAVARCYVLQLSFGRQSFNDSTAVLAGRQGASRWRCSFFVPYTRSRMYLEDVWIIRHVPFVMLLILDL